MVMVMVMVVVVVVVAVMTKNINKGNKMKDKTINDTYVIIRTYSAGVHFGKIIHKTPTEVVLTDTRRMRTFKCLDDGDSLSHIALNGIHPDSNLTAAIPEIWLQWIEIIPVTPDALKTFHAQPYEVVKQ